jgi:hypothetical protein
MAPAANGWVKNGKSLGTPQAAKTRSFSLTSSTCGQIEVQLFCLNDSAVHDSALIVERDMTRA